MNLEKPHFQPTRQFTQQQLIFRVIWSTLTSLRAFKENRKPLTLEMSAARDAPISTASEHFKQQVGLPMAWTPELNRHNAPRGSKCETRLPAICDVVRLGELLEYRKWKEPHDRWHWLSNSLKSNKPHYRSVSISNRLLFPAWCAVSVAKRFANCSKTGTS